MDSAPLTESTPDLSQAEYIGFGIRFLAFGIDSIAAMAVFSPLVIWMLGDVDLQQIDPDNTEQALTTLMDYSLNTSVETILMGITVILFWIYKSATPGKMLFKTIIVDASDGKAPSVRQLIIRYLGYFVNMFALGLGFLWIIRDDRKQGWHDKMANTVVIREQQNN